MKRWWSWWVGVLAGGVAAVALLSSVVAWRLHAWPAAQAQALVQGLGAEHEAMWASVWGPLPATEATTLSYAALGWRLWPRPQLLVSDVRRSVPVEVSADGELHIQRVTVGLAWRSLWSDQPQVHDVRVEGLSGSSRQTAWGLEGEWQVHDVWLGPADASGSRPLRWTLDAQLRATQAKVPQPAIDPRPPWLDGSWQGQARWHPERTGEAAHWRDVDLRFKGQLAGQVVPQARLSLARWVHEADRQRMAWEALVLQAQLGEADQQSQLELRAPALVLGPETASGQGLSGSWRSAAPLSIDWRMDSAAPRGRYTALTWPQWRLVPSGRDGARAGGQLQADLSWLPDRRALRWDALLGEVSVQVRGEAERQWRVRGQLELGARAAQWQLEGQAHGGAADAVLWDGPFATEGEWRRWPEAWAQGRLRLAALWPDRWTQASRSALWPAWWSRLDAWPGQLQLYVAQLGWQGWRLSAVEAQLQNEGEYLRLAELEARLLGGQLRAQGDWRPGDGRWTMDAALRDADLAQLRQTLDERLPEGRRPGARVSDAAAGRWSAAWAVSGRRLAVPEWQGRWSLDARAGHWSGFDLKAARDTTPTDRTEWRRLLAHGTVDGGVAHIDRLNLQQAAGRLAADGTIDLQNGGLALDWSELVGGRKRGPLLSLSGPWRTPAVRVP